MEHNDATATINAITELCKILAPLVLAFLALVRTVRVERETRKTRRRSLYNARRIAHVERAITASPAVDFPYGEKVDNDENTLVRTGDSEADTLSTTGASARSTGGSTEVSSDTQPTGVGRR